MDNIKDINLINKEIQDIKEMLAKIKNTSTNNNGSETNNNNTKDNSGISYESINNINKEMGNNRDLINKTND